MLKSSNIMAFNEVTTIYPQPNSSAKFTTIFKSLIFAIRVGKQSTLDKSYESWSNKFKKTHIRGHANPILIY